MPTYTAVVFVNGSTTIPLDATHMNAISNALAQALQADGSGPNLNADVQVVSGHGLIGASDNLDVFKFGLDGSSDPGLGTRNHNAIVYGGAGVFLKSNNYFDGTNDRFINAIGIAYQLILSSAGGVQVRKSTNTPSAGATITWGAPTTLFS